MELRAARSGSASTFDLMRVLYGVQATGNGHITRARVMAPALEAAGVSVDYLFSGRDPEKLFNMEPFGDYQTRRGFTFFMQGSKVNHWKTLTNNNLLTFMRDVKALDLSQYDLVICDFEPVTAWAAKLQGVPSVGIAHQYVFLHDLPDSSSGFMLANQVRLFAPVEQAIGLHWHHFEQPILPPLIQGTMFPATVEEGKVLVYLPHDDPELIRQHLQLHTGFDFYIYCPIEQPLDQGHIHLRPFSRDGFQRDLASCTGVICNSGFGLLSEAQQYGKKILTVPQQGQAEQLSNAEIVAHLGIGYVQDVLDGTSLTEWLEAPLPEACEYPDVAAKLSEWVSGGCLAPAEQLAAELWQTSTVTVTA